MSYNRIRFADNRQGACLVYALAGLAALCLAVTAVWFLPVVHAAEKTTFRAGAAKQSIIPPFPTLMGGYFDRTDTFKGVSTPVNARAVVCDNGTTQVAVVGTDLVAVSKPMVDAARKRIQAETGIPAENVLICAAHDHSAPSGFVGSAAFGQPENPKLTTFLEDQFVEVVKEAYQKMRPAKVGFAYGTLDSITSNRQQGNDISIDPQVGVLKIQAADSRDMIATLFNFTGHPVILGGDNLLLSGEYPGVAASTIEQTIGGIAVFTQGAAGDVTMKRSGPPFKEVERLGHILGAKVIETAEQIVPDGNTTLVSVSRDVQVKPRKVPSPADAKANLDKLNDELKEATMSGEKRAEKRLQRAVDSAETTNDVAQFVHAHPGVLDSATHASVQVMEIGPLVLTAIPGELFVEYGLEMKRRVKQHTGHPMILVGYANNYIGYLISPRAVYTGGYEQAISRVAPTAARTLTEAAMDLVNENIPPVN